MEAGPDHPQQVQSRVAGNWIEKRTCLTDELHDLEVIIHHDARRRIPAQQHLLADLLQVELLLWRCSVVAMFFFPLDKKHRVYSKKTIASPFPMEFVPRFEPEEEDHRHRAAPQQKLDLQKIGEQMLLHRYSPASVMVNDHLEIVQFIGQTGPFLDPIPGDATLNLLRMVRTGLHMELRVAFQKAKRNGT